MLESKLYSELYVKCIISLSKEEDSKKKVIAGGKYFYSISIFLFDFFLKYWME